MTDQTNPFLDAGAAAIVAKQVARDVLQHIEDSGEGASVNIRVVAPVSGTFPDHPLDTALRDLALATQASSRAAEAACRPETPPAYAQAVGSAALLAANALSLTESVAASPARRSDPQERIRMVHAVAATAFAAARLDSSSAYRGERQQYTPPRYPVSWHRLIDTLSDAINQCSTPHDGVAEQRDLVNAAAAARDGAQAARRAYVSLQVSNAAPGLPCRGSSASLRLPPPTQGVQPSFRFAHRTPGVICWADVRSRSKTQWRTIRCPRTVNPSR